jgi:anti-sigma factor RsiW
VNTACRELEVLISLRAASDELPLADAARLDAHLAGCPACAEELERSREVLDLARLPPPGAAESLAMADLTSRTLAVLRRRDRRRSIAWRVLASAAGLAVAATVVIALLSPAVIRYRTPRFGTGAVATATQAAWEEPDMDALWTESAVLDYATDSSDGGSSSDAVLAAYDAGAGD